MINSDELIENIIEGKMTPDGIDILENRARLDTNSLVCALLSLVGELVIQRYYLRISNMKTDEEQQTATMNIEHCTYAMARMFAIIRCLLCSCMPEDQAKQLLEGMTGNANWVRVHA